MMATKTEIREWMKRARDDLRGLESALADDDAETAYAYAEDLSGVSGEILNLVVERYDNAPRSYVN